ncbi:energy transducer TonB [Sulfurimonas sp.]|uniref:energy transducer TonB n=1 Tax=Sulfurimonas sp. TaxID=2022749 RepID=UPI0025FE0714|nr:energy transducer TonB [Sulfurimonas sp.]
MIRHGSSFFFSLIFHGILVLILFLTWKNIPSLNKVNCDDKVRMQLCNIIVEKPVIKPTQEPKPAKKTKPIPKKIKNQKVNKIIKKIQTVKEIPIVMPEIIKEELVVEEVIENKSVQIANTMFQDTEAKQVRLEKEHIDKIIQLLQDNLYYPRRARKRGTTGEVMVMFTLSRDAKPHSIKVLSSNSEILSNAAVKTIQDLSGKYPKPKEELILHIPINYSLHE